MPFQGFESQIEPHFLSMELDYTEFVVLQSPSPDALASTATTAITSNATTAIMSTPSKPAMFNFSSDLSLSLCHLELGLLCLFTFSLKRDKEMHKKIEADAVANVFHPVYRWAKVGYQSPEPTMEVYMPE